MLLKIDLAKAFDSLSWVFIKKKKKCLWVCSLLGQMGSEFDIILVLLGPH